MRRLALAVVLALLVACGAETPAPAPEPVPKPGAVAPPAATPAPEPVPPPVAAAPPPPAVEAVPLRSPEAAKAAPAPRAAKQAEPAAVDTGAARAAREREAASRLAELDRMSRARAAEERPGVRAEAGRAARAREESAPPRMAERAVPAPPPSRAGAALPEFPWPPPTPSAQIVIPDAVFRSGAAPEPALSAVGKRLVGALEQAKYFEYSHYRVPNGFALVARLERVGTDGTPMPEQFRFLQPGSQEPFSLAAYVKQLFFAPEGLYRQIVFVVTDQPFTATGGKLDARAAAQLLTGGANRLSSDYDTTPFTAAHRVSALVYEFSKGAREGDVSTLTPGRLGARTHLDRAGIYPALATRQ